MGHFFDRRDPWGNRFSLYVVLGMFFLMPLAWWSLKQIRLENDVENWLPADDPELKILRWAHTQFPVDERIFVTWQGSALGDPRVAELASQLNGTLDSEGIKRSGPVEVAGVIQPRDVLDNILKSNVPYHEAIRRMEGTLVGGRPAPPAFNRFCCRTAFSYPDRSGFAGKSHVWNRPERCFDI